MIFFIKAKPTEFKTNHKQLICSHASMILSHNLPYQRS